MLSNGILRRDSKKQQIFGVCSPQSLECLLVDFCCIFNQVVSVPVQESSSEEVIEFIVRNSEMETIFCAPKFVKLLIGISSRVETLKTIVCLEGQLELEETEKSIASEKKISVFHINQLKVGNEKEISFLPQKDDLLVSPKQLKAIIFTSGSTGYPKGVCVSIIF